MKQNKCLFNKNGISIKLHPQLEHNADKCNVGYHDNYTECFWIIGQFSETADMF